MIKLDENQLVNDLILTSLVLGRTSKNDLIKNNYFQFLSLNKTLIFNFGKVVLLEADVNKMDSVTDKSDDKALATLVKFFNDNQDIVLGLSNGYLKIVDKVGFEAVPFYDVMRSYSEKDFKDIIMGYFSTFGNDYYKIVKCYFDENRIHTNTFTDDFKCGGFFSGLQWMSSGYVFSAYHDYNTASASVIVHELGHAIDAEKFLFPQMKNMPILGDSLVEVPSTTFEMGFYDYLIKNRIDTDGSAVLKNSRLVDLKTYSEVLKEIINKEEIAIDYDGSAYCEDDNQRYDLRDSLIYQLGYYFALHFNEIRKSSNKEFIRQLNDFMTSRKEATLQELIERLGFTLEEFETGKIIEPVVEENVLRLKKRFNIEFE